MKYQNMIRRTISEHDHEDQQSKSPLEFDTEKDKGDDNVDESRNDIE